MNAPRVLPQVTRVLVLDDNVTALRTIGSVIRRIGFAVSEAHTPAGALLALHQERPDVVLLDLQFPDCDGVAFADEIRQDRIYDGTALVAMGSCVNEWMRESILRWATGFLIKPFTTEEAAQELLCALALHARSRPRRSASTAVIKNGISVGRSVDW